MKKPLSFFLILVLSVFLYGENTTEMLKNIGYEYSDDILFDKQPDSEHPASGAPLSYFTRLEQLSLCEGGVSLSGSTGLIELPTAFISSHGFFNANSHILYTDSNFSMQNTRYSSEKLEFVTNLNYGFRRNAECGFNVINVKNDIVSTLSNFNYRVRKDFVTFNIKWSTPYKGKAVAFGAQYTNLTNEEQLLMDYMDLEKMNGVYVTMSDQVSPRLFTTFTLKNTFVRSVNIPPIHIEKQDLTIAGAGIEYRWGYTSLLAECKKLWGDYINGSNDFAFNAGVRYRHYRITWDFAAVNLNNGSDAIYTGGVGYTF